MRIIIEEIRKCFKLLAAYPIEIAFWILGPILWVVPLIFQGRALLGSLRSPAFASVTGTEEFIPYVLIGAIFSTYMFSAVWSMGNSLRDETYFGTLEHILSAPVRPVQLLIGKGLYNSLLSTVFVLFQLALCALVFGLSVTFSKILPVLLFLLLLVIGLYGIGFCAAAVTLLVKESHGILHLFEYVLFLFSPIRYPVEINPVTRAVSMFIPLTYALIALRGLLLGIRFDFWKNCLALLAIDLVLIPLGIMVFIRIERYTKAHGTLAHY